MSERPRQSIVPRAGRAQITRRGISGRPLSDLYHYILVTSWARFFAILVVFFFLANALFAMGYLVDPGGIEGARRGSFPDAFFFSVHTLGTIGYGRMAPVSTFANILVSVEAMTGLISLALVTGLTFAKFSRPTARVLWSRVAVIDWRDGRPCLMFRMANARQNQIVEAELHVVLARQETTQEGEEVRRFHDLKLVRQRNAIFALSWTAIHPLDEGSPLHGQTRESLTASGAEIIATVMGVDETFSQSVHARFSYLPEDLRFSMRLKDIVLTDEQGLRYVDYTHFHDVEASKSWPKQTSG